MIWIDLIAFGDKIGKVGKLDLDGRAREPPSPRRGTPPPALVGRDELIAKFRLTVGRAVTGRPGKSVMPIGLRGVGKTVLLNAFNEIAEDEGLKVGYIEAPETGDLRKLLATRLRKILLDLDRAGKVSRAAKRALGALSSFTYNLPDGSSISLNVERLLRVAMVPVARGRRFGPSSWPNGWRVRVLRRDLDQLFAEAEASATSAGQPGADACQDGEGWPDAEAFWGGPSASALHSANIGRGGWTIGHAERREVGWAEVRVYGSHDLRNLRRDPDGGRTRPRHRHARQSCVGDRARAAARRTPRVLPPRSRRTRTPGTSSDQTTLRADTAASARRPSFGLHIYAR